MHGSRLGFWVLSAFALVGVVAVPVASAQETAMVEVTVSPDTVSVNGETVRFTVDIVLPAADLPATITELSSDLYGDIADAGNPAISSTDCVVPVGYTPTGGFMGMACSFEVLVDGDPGEVTTIISATATLADSTEITVTDTTVVSISEDLGAIRGVLIDADTGQPIPGVFVWGTCDGCGGFTDSGGTFIFDGVEPGEYRLRSGSASPGGWSPTAPDGYQTEYAYEWFEEDPVGPPGVPDVGTRVVVLPGETTEIDWELTIGGVIEGRLTSADNGDPITGYRVLYWIVAPGGSTSPEDIGGNSVVTTDGGFRLFGLRAGDYIVCFETAFGNRCWDDVPLTTIPPTTDDLLGVALGQTTSGIDAQIATESATGDGDGDALPVLPFTGPEPLGPVILAVALMITGGVLLSRGHEIDSPDSP